MNSHETVFETAASTRWATGANIGSPARSRTWTLLTQIQRCCQLHHRALMPRQGSNLQPHGSEPCDLPFVHSAGWEMRSRGERRSRMAEPWIEQGSLPFQGSATTVSAIRPMRRRGQDLNLRRRSPILFSKQMPSASRPPLQRSRSHHPAMGRAGIEPAKHEATILQTATYSQ